MSVISSRRAGKVSTATPNCLRLWPKSLATRKAASAMPSDWAAMPTRAPFIRLMTYVTSPRWRSPMSLPGASSKKISHVGLPWMPSLFSSRRTFTRGPRSTSSRLSPRPSAISGSVRASTSRISPQPLVMKRFTPWTNQFPSASW
jgi:hypothetical protein